MDLWNRTGIYNAHRGIFIPGSICKCKQWKSQQHVSGLYRNKCLWASMPFHLALNIYNVYNRANPLGRYLSYQNNPTTNKPEPVLKQFTLFPFLPTLSLGVKF